MAREIEHPRGVAEVTKHLGGLMYARGDGAQAADLFGESLTRYHAMADPRSTSDIVEWMASVSCLRGLWVRSARLFGAAETMRAALGAVIDRPMADHDRDLAEVRTRLGEEAFADEPGDSRMQT